MPRSAVGGARLGGRAAAGEVVLAQGGRRRARAPQLTTVDGHGRRTYSGSSVASSADAAA
jgi:hypothetical protein